ncbi:MAG: peptidoglycan DD-metalloendopeptidase family protein [Mollicutes bacterium]|nr:peptidoglycan DD-metalloendopeptidase family protein [Mollicutes bacterium]
MKILMIVVSLILIIIPKQLDADNSKTLKDLIDELNALERKLREIKTDKSLTETKIRNIENNIIKIGLDINDIEKNIFSIQDSITNLNNKIKDKEMEIKTLLNFLQLGNSENFYYEYLLGSTTLTEFILRYGVIEQLTGYNKELIELMNDMILKRNEKINDLKTEKTKLKERKEALLVEQMQLGERMNFLDEDARSLEEEIKEARKTIENYRKLGCRTNDLLEICSKIPATNIFFRPLEQGYITSTYGIRDNPLTTIKNDYIWHYAIDIGGNKIGTPVYAASSGRVVLVHRVENPLLPNSSCGGNYVIIQHNLKGVYYATRYMHLSEILVTENELVDSNTIIGLVGGNEIYDRCSTGPHLDFAIARGIYAKDFFYFREPYTINPTSLISFPSLGIWFYSRF